MDVSVRPAFKVTGRLAVCTVGHVPLFAMFHAWRTSSYLNRPGPGVGSVWREPAVWWHLIYAGLDRLNISERPASCSAWAVLKERHVVALGAERTSPWRPSTTGWKRFAELVQLAKQGRHMDFLSGWRCFRICNTQSHMGYTSRLSMLCGQPSLTRCRRTPVKSAHT